MFSAAISWYGATKPFFVNENGIKVNKENYCKHSKNSCFLQSKNLLSVTIGYFSKIVLRHIGQRAVWKNCATDLKPLRKEIKQFVPRLPAVEEKQGYCIKMMFG